MATTMEPQPEVDAHEAEEDEALIAAPRDSALHRLDADEAEAVTQPTPQPPDAAPTLSCTTTTDGQVDPVEKPEIPTGNTVQVPIQMPQKIVDFCAPPSERQPHIPQSDISQANSVPGSSRGAPRPLTNSIQSNVILSNKPVLDDGDESGRQHAVDQEAGSSSRNSAPQPHDRNIGGYRSWLLEFFLCIFSTSCYIVVMLIIHIVRGKPPPDWRLGQLDITVNALISLVTELAKLSMSASIASILAQLKWLWFVQPRPLLDLQVHEDAVHGLWGSSTLLFRKKSSLLARGAALYILTSLFTAPFTQQALGVDTSPLTLTGPDEAWIPIVAGLSRWTGSSFVPMPYDRTKLIRAISSAAFIQNSSVPYLEPTCSTAECDWLPYGSLGICSGVKNITEFAMNDSGIISLARAKISNLYNSSSQSAALVLIPERYLPTYVVVSNFIPSPTKAFNQSVTNTMHANLFIAYSNEPLNISAGFDDNLNGFHFLEVALYWCTKSYSTSVKNGTSTTVELFTKSEILTPQAADMSRSLSVFYNAGFTSCYDPHSPPCQGYGGMEVDFAAPDGLPLDSKPKYWVDLWTALAMSFTTHFAMVGGALQTAGLTIYADSSDTALALSTALFGDRIGLEPYPLEVQLQNIQQTAANIARGLTNALRELPPAPGQQSLVYGTAYTPQVVFTVRWPWTFLITCQLVLTWVLLWLTIRMNMKEHLEVVRGDLMATGHIFQISPVLPPMSSTLSALHSAAGNTIVRLQQDEAGKGVKFLAEGPAK